MGAMKEAVSSTMTTKVALVRVFYATTDAQTTSWALCPTKRWPQS
jgi:hypothetical protein